MSLPDNNPARSGEPSPIAGSVLPIQRAEELLTTLPGVISARIVASPSGAVEEIHILTTSSVTPKQTVRNVESALIAHLGMHVSHKKISVAQSDESVKPQRAASAEAPAAAAPAVVAASPAQSGENPASVAGPTLRRKYYFEDIEVRRSRSKGITCRVTLKKGSEMFAGEAEGMDTERLRMELAARATLSAIQAAEADDRVLSLEGCQQVEAFDRDFVFVGVTTRLGRETILMTGTAEVRESPETSSVLAILDATNRWLERTIER